MKTLKLTNDDLSLIIHAARVELDRTHPYPLPQMAKRQFKRQRDAAPQRRLPHRRAAAHDRSADGRVSAYCCCNGRRAQS